MFVHYQLNKKKIEGKDRRTVEAYLNKLSFGDHYNFSTDIHIYSFSFLLCFQKKQWLSTYFVTLFNPNVYSGLFQSSDVLLDNLLDNRFRFP